MPINDYLKDIGEKPIDFSKPAKVSPAEAEAPAERPLTEPPSWPITRGVTHGLGQLALGVPKLAGQLLPTAARNTLGSLAQQIPGVPQAQDWANQPPQSTTEGVANFATQVGAGFLMPELGVGAKAEQFVNPAKFVAGRGFVKPPSTLGTAARVTGETAEQAGKGAVGSMVADPDEPAEAGIAGAVGGAVPRVAGAGLTTPGGQKFAGHASRIGAYEAATHALQAAGVPFPYNYILTAPLLKYYNSPAGKAIAAGGGKVADVVGRFLKTISPAGTGVAIGRGVGAVGPGQTYRDPWPTGGDDDQTGTPQTQ